MKVTFNRAVLYEEVWSQPMTRLAKRYGLSDNGLRKICNAMNIPLPKIGHWSRIAAGQLVERPPLPPKAGRTAFTSRAPMATEYRLPADDIWLAERLVFEREPSNAIVCDAAPHRWHPVAAQWRQELRAKAKTLIQSQRAAQREARLPTWRQPSSRMDSYDWRWYERNGQRIPSTHHACAFRVSLATYERALRILNALCCAAQARGFTLENDKKVGRILMRGYDAELKLRIAERQKIETRNEIRYDGRNEKVRIKIPDGHLQIFVGFRWSSEVCVSDSSTRPVETILWTVCKAAYRFILRTREDRRRTEERDRQEREGELRRQAEAARQQESARLAEELRRRKLQLVSEATAWQQAQLVREYLNHIESSLSKVGQNFVDPRLVAWHTWARGVADELDPTAHRLKPMDGSDTLHLT
jgi:hypothetical protein